MPGFQTNPGIYGASDLTRTGDLLITSEMHYRLCYTSKPVYYIDNIGKCQLLFYKSKSNPTGQWSEPITSAWMVASLIFSASREDTTK